MERTKREVNEPRVRVKYSGSADEAKSRAELAADTQFVNNQSSSVRIWDL